MNEDTNTVDIEDVSLAEFEAEFFGTKSPEPEVKEEVQEDVEEFEEENPLATDDDDADEDEEQDDEDDDSEEEEEVEKVPQIKQKRNKTQERIEKLVAEARQAERERDALRAELEKAKAEKEAKTEEVPNVRDQLPPEAPTPDDLDDNGDPKYELGEFDPKFIRDLTKFTILEEQKAIEAQKAEQERVAELARQQQEITDKWVANVDKAEAEIPEIRQSLAKMGETFNNVEPAYGEYLASAIMQSDVGPQIMHYLSQNIDEAKKIVASGPVAATLALGRLEARLTKEPEQKRNTKQVSKAPEPPEDIERARGRNGRFAVAPDTDDQAAFERAFFS